MEKQIAERRKKEKEKQILEKEKKREKEKRLQVGSLLLVLNFCSYILSRVY